MPRKSSIDQVGFTLIETIIYIALFALVMTAILLATHQLIESTGITQTKAHVEGDAQFVLSKIDEALNGATDFAITTNAGVQTLNITNPNLPSGESPVHITRADDVVTFERNSAGALALNGKIAPVTSLVFAETVTGTQKTLTTTFIVTTPLLNDPLTYTSTRAIRK